LPLAGRTDIIEGMKESALPENRTMISPSRPRRVVPSLALRAGAKPSCVAVRLVGAALLCALVLLATSRSPARSETDAKEIARLIDQLGDDDLDVRKAAEKKLSDIGDLALEPLRKAVKNHLDPDVRLRALVLARAIEKGAFAPIRKFIGHAKTIRHIALSRDGKRALTSSDDMTVRLWDVQTGKELQKLSGHTSFAFCVAFSPNEKQAVSTGCSDQTVRLWNLQDGKEVRKIVSPKGMAYGCTFTPDGKHVLVGGAGADCSLRLFEIESGKEVRNYEGHTGYVWGLLLSPDGKKVATIGCNDYSFRIWDLETGKTLVTGAHAHKGYVVGVAFSPDGKHLLTSGRDMTIKLWEVDTGKLVRTYLGISTNGKQVLTNNVESLAFSPDGKRFLAGEDRFVHLFDTASGKVVHSIEVEVDPAAIKANKEAGWICALAFVDARHALGAGGDGIMRLWGLPR
jgi:WD40 repeat protein